MPAKVISIPEIGEVHIYKRRKSKNLKLSLNHQGKVRVTTPYWLPYSAAIKYAETKKDWIVQNTPRRQIINHLARIGKYHRINYIPDSNRTNISTRLTMNQINIFHPAHIEFESLIVQESASKASIRALKKQSEALLPNRLAEIARQKQFDYADVGVKQLTGRWGSCSSKKEIILSCFLIQLPWHLIDYVILHELTHTKVMRHGRPFWDEMAKHTNNLKQLRKEIKDYNPVIIPID